MNRISSFSFVDKQMIFNSLNTSRSLEITLILMLNFVNNLVYDRLIE